MSEPTPTPEALQAAIDRALALADSWTSLGEHDQVASRAMDREAGDELHASGARLVRHARELREALEVQS